MTLLWLLSTVLTLATVALKWAKRCLRYLDRKSYAICNSAVLTFFLDLKFHDIPNTTAHAVAAAAELGVWMVNVHASGGARMMTAAREALLPFGSDAPLLIAVTVLTSMDENDLRDLGVTLSPAEHAERLARLTQNCGLDGVVCFRAGSGAFQNGAGPEFQTGHAGYPPSGQRGWRSAPYYDP
ncbi:orotidine 5'-phosphate decarboxylase [Enterobacter cloacae]|uniref:Orotidine 5'-phosphate decarboxylase n=1 Tax=Enterobacter cloacae TaxID=550 RepID=A0A377M1C1_ENTCL|nr:orotidine 5'-phosphate decarboxylase [Enterobacter cloacae]